MAVATLLHPLRPGSDGDALIPDRTQINQGESLFNRHDIYPLDFAVIDLVHGLELLL